LARSVRSSVTSKKNRSAQTVLLILGVRALSRHLHDIGDRQRSGKAGFGLIEMRTGRTFRDKEVYLTPKGRALLVRMERDWQMSAKGD
jgi:hypothetical protein